MKKSVLSFLFLDIVTMFRADRSRNILTKKNVELSIVACSNNRKTVRSISDQLGPQTRYRETGDISREVGSGRREKLHLKMKII